MTDIIEKVFNFNKDAGLLDKPYDDFLESSFQIEEALEGFDLSYFAKDLNSEFKAPRKFSAMDPKEISRAIVTSTGEYIGSDVDRFDKHIDSIIYDIGSIAKLGLTPEQIARGIQVVIEANMTKLQCKKDELGKLGKPTDFVGPEKELQKILDER